MRQTNDYNCGPAAIIYFLKLYGVECPLTIQGVEDAVCCNPERGTTPEAIEQLISAFLPVKAQFNTKQLVAPSIVLYLAESRDKESGHYGVVTFVGAEYVTIFDPFSDREYWLKAEYFKHDWQCPWYGDRWMLTTK